MAVMEKGEGRHIQAMLSILDKWDQKQQLDQPKPESKERNRKKKGN
jgi:hypothetical protein